MKSEYFYIFVFISFSNYVHMLPHDYCLHPFNSTNCNGTPTPVFYYYKPGSRCEIATWRGCPTMNKFDNEFLCSHYCIGKLWGRDLAEPEREEPERVEDLDTCQQTLNTKDCGKAPKEIYTYTNGTCEKGVWYGCDTHNKFKDEVTCEETCIKIKLSWKENLLGLTIEKIAEINNFLNDVVAPSQIIKTLNYLDNNTQTTNTDNELTGTSHVTEITPTTDTVTNVTDVTDVTELTHATEVTATTEVTAVSETTQATVATTEAYVTDEPTTEDIKTDTPASDGSAEEVITT